MRRFFSRLASKDKLYSTQTEKLRWEPRRLRNSSNLVHHIPDPDPELKINNDALYHTPLHIASFVCHDFLHPIEEVLIARFRDGLISSVIFSRTGVSKQLLEAVRAIKVNAIWCTNFLDDQRKRVLLTTTCEDETQLARMNKFLDIAQIDNLDLKNYIHTIFDPKNKEAKPAFDLPFLQDLTPPYFRHQPHTAYFGGPSRYNHYSDGILPKTVPPLHLAIANGDFLAVQKIITEDPFSVLLRDPKGVPACKLAQRSGSMKIFSHIVAAREKVVPTEDKLQQNYRVILSNPDLKDDQCLTRDEQDIFKNKYLSQFDTEIPSRSTLHTACIEGDLETVKNILKTNPQRLEEQDPLAFTPLILAAANGHAKIVEWLIEFGATIKNVWQEHKELGGLLYRLIDHAANPAVMERILFHYVDPDVVNDRLATAVRENDFEMVKILLFYISKLHTDRVGLTPLDIVINHSSSSDTAMLKLFLKYWEDYVPAGPYDEDISETIGNIFSDHNKKIQKKEETRNRRPIIKPPMVLDKQLPAIITELTLSDDKKIISTIKPMSSVSENEFNQCHELFRSSFQMRVDDTPLNKKKYLEKLFINNIHEHSYIDICTVDEKIISFLAFECRESNHPTIGKFLLFHGQLGATSPAYEEKNLANLAFRVSLAMKKIHQDIPVIVFVKAIQPGFGACLLPRQIKFFPKFELPQELMQHIVSLTGEILDGKKITAKLKVIQRPIRELNLQLEQYKHLIGEKVEDALAIGYYVDEMVIETYLEHLQFHGVTEENLQQFATIWKDFFLLSALNNSKLEAKF